MNSEDFNEKYANLILQSSRTLVNLLTKKGLEENKIKSLNEILLESYKKIYREIALDSPQKKEEEKTRRPKIVLKRFSSYPKLRKKSLGPLCEVQT